MRIPALLPILVLALSTGCASTDPVPASDAGTWRIGGATGAAFRATDQGAFGDTIEYGAEASVGRFLSPRVLLEVDVDATFSELEVEAAPDLESSTVTALGGLRFYFEHEGRSRPYVGLGAGISALDVEGPGGNDSDTAFTVVGRAGYETFLSPAISLDFGVRVTQIFDRELGGVEEDVTQGAFLIGLAAYF